ncbi:MAG TPA: PSD1 and planctomycete cytochrome C domain-containing protein, partial [Isosphaeraceae bacterium]|nr:PSD1 and planctomycete cytochrome C domain-containing protein [Isosphaeraceae bacterium]
TRCVNCHGNGKPGGKLKLTSRANLLKGGDSGPAAVIGKPEESLLVQAVRYDDPAVQMPPKGKLDDAQIATLVEWVKRGAPDPRTGPSAALAQRTIDIEAGRRHWSFQPLKRPEPPFVRDESWCRTPIDRFILAKLEEKGLAPSDPASRRQYLRRASFDLIGLPPSPEEVEAFVNDPAPDAYERLIDRLLASPHHGERWARHWLDLARFGESHGFEHDYDRPSAYHYRDFLIQALNEDLPYNTFVKWQLAGDELAPQNDLAQAATGFLAAGVHSTQITANQVEKERYDELDDMANTMGTAFLGLTVGCARCHDHKYDPIPQRDYYRLLATFTTVVRTEVDFTLDRQDYLKAKAAFDWAHAPYVAALTTYESEHLPGRLAEWEEGDSCQLDRPSWVILDLDKTTSEHGATFTKLDDGSLQVGGKNAESETYTFVAQTSEKGITAIRLEAMADPALPHGGPGRADSGNFALTDFRVSVTQGSGTPKAVTLKAPRATFEQKGLPVAAAIDSDAKSGWAVEPEFGKDQAAVFETESDLGGDGGITLTMTLAFKNNTGHAIGRPRVSVTSAPRPADAKGAGIPERILRIVDTTRSARKPEQTAALLAWYRLIDPEWQALHRNLEAHAKLEPKPKVVKAMISSEGLPPVRLHTQGADFLEKTHFLKRGDPNQKLGEATQSFLQVLISSPEQEKHWQLAPPAGWRTSYRRASLAEWMTDVDGGAGHLLARVIVNRLWQHHFGRGIVATPSDFGTQGGKPSHPELLDWLASQLVRTHWRLKPIHKLIMLSAIYREGSQPSPLQAGLDPDDALFARHSRQRLEAEVLRDSMLAVSGRLDPQMFGPGTLDERMTRRSIYFTVKRSKLIPMMLLFDAPDGLQPIALRSSTTVAPQSLLMMNSPTVRDWATSFAKRVAPKPETPLDQAVASAYQVALGRSPTPAELQDDLAFLDRQASTYQAAGQSNPRALALTDFCQALMSLNEFIYIE